MQLSEAKRLAAELVTPADVERIRLEDALGRVLAQNLTAPFNLPLQPRSRLDGFALASADAAGAGPERLSLLRVLPDAPLAAGRMPDLKIEPGECVRILTGAPLPPGADAVVAVEDVLEESGLLVLDRSPAPGSGVVQAGDEIREKEPILSRGEILSASRLAFAAAFGNSMVPVYRQPRAALLATGDEVRELGRDLKGSGTYCNNRLLLGWLTRLHGGKDIHLGVAGDDPDEIAGKLKGLDADFVITTGGIGRGDRDFIPAAWEVLGVRTLFRELDLSPGKNSAMGVSGEQIFLALPGSPWGAQLVFEEIASPMLRLFQGLKEPRPPVVKAELAETVRKRSGVSKALRGRLDMGTLVPSFMPLERKGGSLFASLKDAIGYILLDSHVVEVAPGSEVEVRLHDFPLLATTAFGGSEFRQGDGQANR